MDRNPLVSIVLTSYNQPELLERAFNSLIEQSYTNIEIVIVDDHSTDPRNKEKILEFKKHHPEKVKYLLHPQNLGIAKNKNSGFKLCSGDFITYLDGDDWYFPLKIESEIQTFQSHPEYDVVYSNFIFATPDGILQNPWTETAMPVGNIFKEVVLESFPRAILFRYELARSSIFNQYGYYNEDLKLYEDWNYRMRYAASSLIGYNPYLGSVYRRTAASITQRVSLTEKLNQKSYAIDLNKQIIEQHPDLFNYTKTIRKKNDLEKLYDTRSKPARYLLLLSNTVFKYPLEIMLIFKSAKYYLFNFRRSK